MLRSSAQAVDDMSHALSTAARAYEVADQASARGLQVSK
jgi:hypothetical protein